MPIEYEKKNETLGGCLKSKKVLYYSIHCQSTKIEILPFLFVANNVYNKFKEEINTSTHSITELSNLSNSEIFPDTDI